MEWDGMIWNDMDYIWILLPVSWVSCSPVFQVECAACTLDTAIYLGTTCAASSATAVLTATTLGVRMTGGRGSRDFTKIQNSFQQYLTLFDFWITFGMCPMCPVSLVDRLVGSNIRCIDFGTRCPGLHLHTIRYDSGQLIPFGLFVLAGNTDEWMITQALHLSAWLCRSQL